jgi:O-antigen/teichoic acid export membrane protein
MKLTISKLDHLKKNDFIRHNAVMFAGSISVGALNYLYYPIIGRAVSTAQFGEVQALVSLFLQITLVLGVSNDVTVNIVANTGDEEKRNQMVYEFERLVTLLMTIIVIFAFIAIKPIDNFLHIVSPLPVIILGVSLIIAASASQRSAFLRGINAFGSLSISQVISASGKLVASLIFVLAGFGTAGAIGGLVVSQILTVVYLFRITHKNGLRKGKNDKLFRLPSMSLVRPELSFALLVLIVSIVTTVFFSIDVVLVKHYFPAKMAGQYAGVATIARIIYFLTGSVATVLLSAVQLKAPLKTNRKLFLRSLGLTAILGGFALLVFGLLPRLCIKILIGSRYLPLAGLLPKLGLTLFVISIVNLVFSYDVALRRWSIAIISIIGMVTTGYLVAIWHQSPSQIVNALLVGSLLLLVIRAADSFRRNILKIGPGKTDLSL